MNVMKKTISKLSRLTILTVGCSLGSILSAQTNVDMTTTITNQGGGQYSIRQFGNGDPTAGLLFNFEKLDSVAPNPINIADVIGINLTFTFYNESLDLVISTTTQGFTGAEGDFGEIVADFTSASPRVFSYGAASAESFSKGILSGADFEDGFVQDLENEVFGQNDSKTYSLEPFTLTETRNVSNAEGGWNTYGGTGTFDLSVRNTWPALVDVTGVSGVSAEAIIGQTDFFAEVEYIVIPEPGALGLMVIAMGTAGVFALMHRRKQA